MTTFRSISLDVDGDVFSGVLDDGTAVYDLTGVATPRVVEPPGPLWPFADDVDVVLNGPTVLDVDATVNSLHQNGHPLTILAGVTLRSRGNIVNDAPLVIDGTDPELTTVIEFIDVDESAMVGSTAGHSGAIATDVGLWTLGHGTLEAHGAPKLAWCRSTAPISAGQSTFTADAVLDGWRIGDEVVITPTARTDRAPHRSTITAVDGSTFTLADPTTKAHPTVDVWGTVHTAEFLNLTRNVKITGTPTGRAHTVFLHCHHAQHISFVEYAHMGPMGPTPTPVVADPHPFLPLGRWAVHFHHGGDDVVGSTVEGVVCRDVGTYAFVPHKANGVTFTDCIAHNVGIGAYWWDDHQAVARQLGITPGANTQGDSTDRAVFTQCVASHVQGTTAWDGTPAAGRAKFGWSMGNGDDCATIDCVAAGVLTHPTYEGGGYSWRSTHSGVWATNGSIAHNSTRGIDLWNNNESRVIVHEAMTQYHCEKPMRDGAYRTVFGWSDLTIVGQLQSVAGKRTTVYQQFLAAPRPDIVRLRIDAGGLAPYAFIGADHHQNFLNPNAPMVVSVAASEFKGGTVACVGFNHGDGTAHVYEFIDPVFHGNEWWLESVCPADSVITWKRAGQCDCILRPVTYAGDTSAMTWHPEWNAWVSVQPTG